ncbi:hypothetical protein ACFSX2_08240 [Amycolatopsis jiangsuensis]
MRLAVLGVVAILAVWIVKSLQPVTYRDVLADHADRIQAIKQELTHIADTLPPPRATSSTCRHLPDLRFFGVRETPQTEENNTAFMMETHLRHPETAPPSGYAKAPQPTYRRGNFDLAVGPPDSSLREVLRLTGPAPDVNLDANAGDRYPQAVDTALNVDYLVVTRELNDAPDRHPEDKMNGSAHQHVDLESLLLRVATGEVICAITTSSPVGTPQGWTRKYPNGIRETEWDFSSIGVSARKDLGVRLAEIAGHAVELG